MLHLTWKIRSDQHIQCYTWPERSGQTNIYSVTPDLKDQVSLSDRILSSPVCLSSVYKLLTFLSSSSEPLDQFQPNLAQRIPGLSEFKFFFTYRYFWIKGHTLLQKGRWGVIGENWIHRIHLHLLSPLQQNLAKSSLGWRGSSNKIWIKAIWIIIMFKVAYVSLIEFEHLSLSEKSLGGGVKKISCLWNEAKILTIEPKFQVSNKTWNEDGPDPSASSWPSDRHKLCTVPL